MSIINNSSLGHIINNIIEYQEGNTLELNPRYSNLRLVSKDWNQIILNQWKIKNKIGNILNDLIYQLEFVLESGACSGCMCFLRNESGGENQLAHYGGCFADDFETESDFEERQNNLKIGDTKFKDYNSLKRKREEDYYNYKKKFKLQLNMDDNV